MSGSIPFYVDMAVRSGMAQRPTHCSIHQGRPGSASIPLSPTIASGCTCPMEPSYERCVGASGPIICCSLVRRWSKRCLSRPLPGSRRDEPLLATLAALGDGAADGADRGALEDPRWHASRRRLRRLIWKAHLLRTRLCSPEEATMRRRRVTLANGCLMAIRTRRSGQSPASPFEPLTRQKRRGREQKHE